VVDTVVPQKTNESIQLPLLDGSEIAKRVSLLRRIGSGELTALISEPLLHEYRKQVRESKTDFVQAFIAIVSDPQRRVFNWAPWSGGHREKAQKCRFPAHDIHVLRTAIRPNASAIVTEDYPMLKSHRCILREFRVSIVSPLAL